MLTIHKYPLAVTDTQTVQMSNVADILTVQVQRGTPCLWALVDNETPWIDRIVHVVGTGHPAQRIEGCQYIGTFQLMDGDLVFHVFIER